MKFLMISIVVLFSTMSNSDVPFPAPVAEKTPVVDVFHDDPRTDNYRWMHDNKDPKVIEHLKKENRYAEQFQLKNIQLQKNLQKEYKTSRSMSNKQMISDSGDFQIYIERKSTENYYKWIQKNKNSGEEVVLLDGNAVAQNYSFFEIYRLIPNPSRSFALVLIDTIGRGQTKPFLLNLNTKELIEQNHNNLWQDDAIWLDNSRILILAAADEMAPQEAYEYDIDTQVESLVQVLGNDDAVRSMYKTSDDSEIILYLKTTLETSTYRYDSASKSFLPFDKTDKQQIANYDKMGDLWYKISNIDSPRFDLFSLVDDKWKKIYSPKKGNLKAFQGHVGKPGFYLGSRWIVVEENFEAMNQLKAIDMKNYEEKVLINYSLFSFSNQFLVSNGKLDLLYFEKTSFIHPKETFKFNLDSSEISTEIPSTIVDYKPENYAIERVNIIARDGEEVPVSLVYKKDLFVGKDQPLNLYGYGSYGASVPYRFQRMSLPLLDRGVVYAMAHVRGGGEKGQRWHDQGRMFHKMNTFYDFIDVAEHFVKTGLTSPGQISIEGRSAGGLLVGTVLNLRPDLFRVAKIGVPFVDVLNTMTLYYDPLAKYEKKEWGDGLIEEQYKYIKSYDPYTNISSQNYPSVLAFTGFEDAAVYYFQPMKWVAKMREYNPQSKNPLVFFTSFKGGHGGDSGVEAKEIFHARNNAFVLSELGIKQ